MPILGGSAGQQNPTLLQTSLCDLLILEGGSGQRISTFQQASHAIGLFLEWALGERQMSWSMVYLAFHDIVTPNPHFEKPLRSFSFCFRGFSALTAGAFLASRPAFCTRRPCAALCAATLRLATLEVKKSRFLRIPEATPAHVNVVSPRWGLAKALLGAAEIEEPWRG